MCVETKGKAVRCYIEVTLRLCQTEGPIKQGYVFFTTLENAQLSVFVRFHSNFTILLLCFVYYSRFLTPPLITLVRIERKKEKMDNNKLKIHSV